MYGERTGPAARYAPEQDSLQALERVLAAARLGEAALMRAARHCGVEDLLSGRARATGTLSFAGNDQES